MPESADLSEMIAGGQKGISMGGVGTFALGVAAALVAGALGPALGRRARPLARGAIKQAIIAGQGARQRAEGLREDWEDLVEEARADVRRQQVHAVPPTND